MSAKFYNETLNKYISIEKVVEELVDYMRLNPDAEYKITVGTDSEGTKETQFVTAIAIVKVGNGGRYFWTKSEKIFCPTLQDRIYKETMRSIVTVQELKEQIRKIFGNEPFWNNKITVHLDVGKIGATKDMVEAVVGMVKGYGFEAVIKPYSYVAFALADRHT